MKKQPSKFWAYIAVIVGAFLILSGLAAAIGYFGIPVFFSFDNALAYELGNIAALYLGLVCGSMAVYQGIASITNRKSSFFKLPSFYIFWIILALVLGLGTLILENKIAIDYLFPPLFMLGAALSTFSVLGWAYYRMGFPITWRQASLAFVCGSTLAIFVAIVLETTFPYFAYRLLKPLWYLTEEFADLAWGAPGFIERLFASPLILVFLAVVAVEAPIPEEFAKALAIPMFGRNRIKNERQAFAIGLASGAGFAILENMLYEGLYAHYSGWSWGGITLLRSIGSVLHPIGTGIIALGWFRMKESGAGKLFKAYLLSVGLHTLWNGGFEPLLYLTGLDHFAGKGSSLTFYGETLSALLVGYLVLLSLGLWMLLRKIVNEISARIIPDLTPATVSKRFIATWAVVSALVIIPVGATFSPAWSAIRALIAEGKITEVELPQIGTASEARSARSLAPYLDKLSTNRPDISGISQPGDVYTYKVTLNKSRETLWSYSWCATTQNKLTQNFEHIHIQFMVNGQVVPNEQIATYHYSAKNNAMYCLQFYSLVKEWPVGRHDLNINVNFDEEINDGYDDYPAGTHTFEYIVTVKQ